jgi:hypothetical protein
VAVDSDNSSSESGESNFSVKDSNESETFSDLENGGHEEVDSVNEADNDIGRLIYSDSHYDPDTMRERKVRAQRKGKKTLFRKGA